MKEAQKFLFDNFIIEEDKIIIPEDKTQEDSQTEEIEITPEPQDFVEEIIPKAKTYTEEELNEKLRLSQEENYEKGFQSAKTGIEAENQVILKEINEKLLLLVTEMEKEKQEQEKEFLQITAQIINKLVPVLEEANAQDLVNNFIAENFANFNEERKISFYLHPDIISDVQENIAKLANHHDFEGKIALHKDKNMAKADCRIEWENGGVERNSAGLRQKVENLLEIENSQTETNNG